MFKKILIPIDGSELALRAAAMAVNLAKEAEVDTPVMVLQSHKARELRINWRDA